VVDAWRIESADTDEALGLLTGNYQLGYRVAVLVSDAWILLVANHFGWPVSYELMAVLMSLGVAGALMAKTPEQAEAALRAKPPLWTSGGFGDAVVGPFVTFFRAYGPLALLMLFFITLRLRRGHFTPERHFGFEGAAWYWHFVDVVWLGLYFLVYWL